MRTSPGDATDRFSDRAEDYARWRPDYPPEAFRFIASEASVRPGSWVADLGAGTGISARPWLELGARVVAVEPNGAMRAVAERELGGHAGFRAAEGTAEATGLAGGSVDLVVAAQAFHWFDRRPARAEIARILRPGGRLALVWNDRVKDATPFDRGYEGLLLAHGTDYRAVDHRQIGDDEIEAFYAPGVPRHVSFPHGQALDSEGLLGRVLSCSYVPAPGEPGHEELVAAVGRLFEEHAEAGRVRISYRTRVWLGRLPPRA